jgi:hypothetical protein
MKRTSPKRSEGGMRPEYRLDYSRSRPNRFAALMKGSTCTVVLDPDVASVFKTSEAVNSLLRSVITALPQRVAPKSRNSRKH